MSTPLMGEFTFMEDWDLQAVVRGSGCSSSSSHQAAFANIIMNNSSFLTNYDQDDDLFKSFSECFESDTSPTGFDHNHGVIQREICKPFYPFLHHHHHQQQQQQPLSPQSMLSSTSSMCIPSCEIKQSDEKLKNKHVICESEAPVSSTDQELNVMATGKSKRSRKNQQKREVKHVKADGLSADKWAWRKYGQKPIKGSPYPRSYYRCSSLKGCLARKQVERSSTDPSIFIITYTAEHSHAHPTRRNSLAGSTRIRSTTPKQPLKPTDVNIIKQEFLDISGPSSSTIPSSMASINDELDQLVQSVRIKSEGEEDEEHILENSSIVSNEEIGMPDIIFSDELFPSLEDFEGMYFDQ